MLKSKGRVVEVFCSYQGEGLYAGARQVFIRLAGCNLHCPYCDTLEAQKLYTHRPISLDRVVYSISSYLTQTRYHSICITGGEPLVQIGFLKDLLVSLRVFHLPLYLETNGTMPSRLRRIIKDVDIVAMDIKQPSYPGIEVKWDETKECLKIASIKELIVKVVITQATGYRDIVKAGQLILEIAPEAPLILQPVTPRGGIYPPPPTQVRRFAKLCRDKGLRTYVIPQLHKLAGWR